MIPGLFKNIKNINHVLDEFLISIEDEYVGVFPPRLGIQSDTNELQFNQTICSSNYDISRIIPSWVVAEKSTKEQNGETNVISVFDFLQKYYDWLYCDNPSGAQYALANNFLDMIDVERTREEFLKRIYSVYFTSFPYDLIKNDGSIIFDLQKARNFIVGIKKNLHGRKTNVEAINYFFTRLFTVSEEDILVYYPKIDILRLNGGVFNNDYFNFVSATGNYYNTSTLGSGLNISRFQDNDWFHDWSYLIYLGTTQENTNIRDAYIKSLHPAGLRLIFGKQLSDYQGPGVSDDDSRVCEYPLLKNYAPYSMTLEYAEIGVHYGVTLYGITGCSGCDGSYQTPPATGFTGPVYVFPTWTGTISGSKFFDINISSFIELCYTPGFTSPNENKSCSNC